MKLLYAEDEPTMTEAVVDILTYHNYLVDAVSDGRQMITFRSHLQWAAHKTRHADPVQ